MKTPAIKAQKAYNNISPRPIDGGGRLTHRWRALGLFPLAAARFTPAQEADRSSGPLGAVLDGCVTRPLPRVGKTTRSVGGFAVI